MITMPRGRNCSGQSAKTWPSRHSRKDREPRIYMLKAVKNQKMRDGGNFAIVASRYNAEYVDAMLHSAREELLKAGAHVRIVRVPGAFEIPVAASKLAQSKSHRYAAIICLGVIFQGETSHAQH